IALTDSVMDESAQDGVQHDSVPGPKEERDQRSGHRSRIRHPLELFDQPALAPGSYVDHAAHRAVAGSYESGDPLGAQCAVLVEDGTFEATGDFIDGKRSESIEVVLVGLVRNEIGKEETTCGLPAHQRRFTASTEVPAGP